MLKAILGLILPILYAILLFAINPFLGVLWIIVLTIAIIYTFKKDLLIRFIEWVFRIRR